MRYISPLRYPGGKARLSPYLERLICSQPLKPSHYAEPFAGGAGAALKLLLDEVVEEIYLNDLNPGIAAFWRSILTNTEDFCQRIMKAELTTEEWKKQRHIYLSPIEKSDIELGFATFYLNRVNRSGILSARPIGGLEQTGEWKMDARFNKPNLVKRVQLIASMQSRIHISEMEGIDFLKNIESMGMHIFIYADPPYVVQGEGLYLHAFDEQAHLNLAEYLSTTPCPWMLTYDDDPRITEALYAGGRCAIFDIAHTAHKQHVGKEAVIYSSDLTIPDMEITAGRIAQWV